MLRDTTKKLSDKYKNVEYSMSIFKRWRNCSRCKEIISHMQCMKLEWTVVLKKLLKKEQIWEKSWAYNDIPEGEKHKVPEEKISTHEKDHSVKYINDDCVILFLITLVLILIVLCWHCLLCQEITKCIYLFKKIKLWGSWLAQSVAHTTLTQGCESEPYHWV